MRPLAMMLTFWVLCFFAGYGLTAMIAGGPC